MKNPIKKQDKNTYIKVPKGGGAGRLVIDGKELPLVDAESIKNAELFHNNFLRNALFGIDISKAL